MNELLIGALSHYLDNMLRRRCIGFTAGEATGSVIDLEFEPRKERIRPLTNPNLTEEQRRGDPEYSILIECAWRLDAPHEVICGGLDDSSPGGKMLSGLQAIVGQALESYQLSQPSLDLTLQFDGDRTLRVFCDQVNEVESNDNWSIFSRRKIVIVGTKGRLRQEPRTGR